MTETSRAQKAASGKRGCVYSTLNTGHGFQDCGPGV